jgi:hypothetical protein
MTWKWSSMRNGSRPISSWPQLADRRRDGLGAALDDRLTPARDAVVGRQLEEQPARRDGEEVELGDPH